MLTQYSPCLPGMARIIGLVRYTASRFDSDYCSHASGQASFHNRSSTRGEIILWQCSHTPSVRPTMPQMGDNPGNMSHNSCIYARRIGIASKKQGAELTTWEQIGAQEVLAKGDVRIARSGRGQGRSCGRDPARPYNAEKGWITLRGAPCPGTCACVLAGDWQTAPLAGLAR